MNKISTVVFRVDASINIGTGHVMRCFTLAKSLEREGIKTIFICRQLEGNLIHFLQKNFTVISLPESKSPKINFTEQLPAHYPWLQADWQEDAQETLKIIETFSPQLLVVDSYALDYRWEMLVKTNDLKLMVIDDLADRQHVANILLDQNAGRTIADYYPLVPKDCKIFCGADYALLKPEFAALRPFSLAKRETTRQIKNVLVTMGGVDRDNATLAVLNYLQTVPEFLELSINIVIGQSYLYKDDLLKKIAPFAKNIKVLQNINNMEKLMAEADVAIGAAGSTAWERCCLGLPTLMTVLADNQNIIAQSLQKSFAAELFDFKKGSSFTLAWHKIKENFSLYSKNASQVCSGDGLFKIISSMNPTLGKSGQILTLRDVIFEDAKMLFEWQSAPETRRFARNKELPLWEDHCHWLKNILKNPLRRLMIMEENAQPAACLRLDWLEENKAEVSIYLNPSEYGRGLGFDALKLLRQLYRTLDFIACVFPENTASQRLFLKAGYVMFKENYYVSQGEKN